MALTRVGSLALNGGETPGTKCVVDKANGFLFVLAGDNLVKITLSTFTRTAVVAVPATVRAIALNPDDNLIYVLYSDSGPWPTFDAHIKAYNIADLSVASTSGVISAITGNLFHPKLLYVNSALYVYHCYSKTGSFVYVKVTKLNPTTLAVDSTSIEFVAAPGGIAYIESVNQIVIFYRKYDTGSTKCVSIFNANTLSHIRTVSSITVIPAECITDNDTGIIYATAVTSAPIFEVTNNEFYKIEFIGNSIVFTLLDNLVIVSPSGLVQDIYSSDIYLISYESPSKIVKITKDPFAIVDELLLTAGDNQIKALGIEGDLTATYAYLYGPDSSAPSDIIKISSSYAIYDPEFTLACLPEIGQISVDLTIQSRDVTNVRVYRRVQGDVAFDLLGETATNQYIDTTVEDEEIYEYKVQQYRAGAWAEESTILSHICTWHPWSPCKPENFRVVYYIDPTYSRIYWDYNITGYCGQTVNWIDGFKVYRKRDDESIYTLFGTYDINNREFTDGLAVSGHIYQYYIVAYNAHRTSEQSKIISVTY